MIYSGCADRLLGRLPRQLHTDKRSCCFLLWAGQSKRVTAPTQGTDTSSSTNNTPGKLIRMSGSRRDNRLPLKQPCSELFLERHRLTEGNCFSRLTVRSMAVISSQPGTVQTGWLPWAGESVARVFIHSKDPPPYQPSTCAKQEDTHRA